MILEYKLNDTEVLSTIDEGKKMTISADSANLFFKMFIKNTYSNPIGSICRELSSNMLDSHVEANINLPAIIRLGEDENTKMPYISFIDFGVGMSPERMNEVYCVLMTSTKRLTNNQIGGFGLGSKSVLAYTRQLAYGSSESDNSFFVITISEGIKYTYLVYEGKESPMLSLLNQEETNEHNGTEIRVPILYDDLYKFEKELVRQLYYFDNIIFENFDNDEITNNYQIVRAKSFLYRDNNYSEFIHISLGKVSYPINYDVIGLDKYDFQFPVAIKFEIGEINVVTSREAVDYSDNTIKLIKKKLFEVKAELHEMLTKQHDNIITLEDYFKFKQTYNQLKLIEGKTIKFTKLKIESLVLKNFKYNNLKVIPDSRALFDNKYRLIEYKFNKRRATSKLPAVNGNYSMLLNRSDIYIWNGSDLVEKRDKKLLYLKKIHHDFFLITKKKISMESIKLLFGYDLNELCCFDKNNKLISYTPLYDTILDIFNEYDSILESLFKKYEDIVIPESYLESIKIKRKFIKGNIVINIIAPSNSHSKETVKLNDLLRFKGTIIYGNHNEILQLEKASRAFNSLFSATTGTESVNYKLSSGGFRSLSHLPKDHKKVLFITVAKLHIKKLIDLQNTTHVDNIYNKFLYRKENDVLLANFWGSIEKKLKSLNVFYLHPDLGIVYPIIGEYIKDINQLLKKQEKLIKLNYMSYNYRDYFDFSKFILTKEFSDIEKKINHITHINELNEKTIECFKIGNIRDNITLIKLLKNALVPEKIIKKRS